MSRAADDDRRSRSTTAPTQPSEPRTPISPSASTLARRPQPLPAVKGTMGGIESPRLEYYSPAPTVHPSPAPSHARSVTASVDGGGDADTDAADATLTHEPEPPASVLVFRADPRMVTCFDGLPEGADEIKAKFGVA